MPWSKKTIHFMQGCAHGMKPNKPGLKCPSKEQAMKMVSEGIARNRRRKR